MLKFSPANVKTERLYAIPELAHYLEGGRKVYSLDLSAGYTCPGAKQCLSKVVVGDDGRATIQDGPHCEFRCFAASMEGRNPNVRRLREHNTALIRSLSTGRQIRELIQASMPKDLGILRYHVSGDFFNRAYLWAAITTADNNPDKLFYGYTKMHNYLVNYDGMLDPARGLIRPNFLLTASLGGKHDLCVNRTGLRYAYVVLLEEEATDPIDHDDSHAATAGGNFALLIHGVQPAGSKASKAMYALRKAKYASK